MPVVWRGEMGQGTVEREIVTKVPSRPGGDRPGHRPILRHSAHEGVDTRDKR